MFCSLWRQGHEHGFDNRVTQNNCFISWDYCKSYSNFERVKYIKMHIFPTPTWQTSRWRFISPGWDIDQTWQTLLTTRSNVVNTTQVFLQRSRSHSLEHACLSRGKHEISELFYGSWEMKGVDLSCQETLNPKDQRFHLSWLWAQPDSKITLSACTRVCGWVGGCVRIMGQWDQFSPACR